jgi:hypothetical protein
MSTLLAVSHHTSVRLAEVGFLLILIAGVWLVAAEFLDPRRWRQFRTVVAGVLLAVAGLLLLIAVHWGSFGSGGKG